MFILSAPIRALLLQVICSVQAWFTGQPMLDFIGIRFCKQAKVAIVSPIIKINFALANVAISFTSQTISSIGRITAVVVGGVGINTLGCLMTSVILVGGGNFGDGHIPSERTWK